MMVSDGDPLAMANAILRRRVIATDMGTLGESVGAFLMGLKESGVEHEDAIYVTTAMVDSLVNGALHTEASHDEGDDDVDEPHPLG